jgi:hypothetical protein
MWYVKDLLDRVQVAFLLWRLRRHRLATAASRRIKSTKYLT